MTYEDKLSLLSDNDFFAFFDSFGATPRWANSNGKKAIQVAGLCHHSHNHSALFDPTSGKVNCFSQCGGGMYLHNWVNRATNSYDGQQIILNWINNEDINLSDRVARRLDFGYEDRKYEPKEVAIIPSMPKEILKELYSRFDRTEETLGKLVWHTKDNIRVDLLREYHIAYYPDRGTIILPHHNVNGEIVGLYERSFLPLRRKVKEQYPEMDFKSLIEYPRSKYIPLLKDEMYRTKFKTSWSFQNSMNLYGLFKAKEAIKKTGIAIVFEGAKSVLLARQYGYPNAVASHTFGMNLNHVSMLIEQGAKEIVLAFDKQYKKQGDSEWNLYYHRTEEFLEQITPYVDVSIIVPNDQIDYKESPIDKGELIFRKLYNERGRLKDKEDFIQGLVPEKERIARQKAKGKLRELEKYFI